MVKKIGLKGTPTPAKEIQRATLSDAMAPANNNVECPVAAAITRSLIELDNAIEGQRRTQTLLNSLIKKP